MLTIKFCRGGQSSAGQEPDPRRRADRDAKGQPVYYELPAAVTARPTRVTGAVDLLRIQTCSTSTATILQSVPLVERKRLPEALLDNPRGLQLVK